MNIEMRPAKRSEYPEVLDLATIAWSGLKRLKKKLVNVPWEYYIPLIIKKRGKIISSLCVFKRDIRVGNQPVLTGGIGDVITHPEHRGQGYGAMLMKYSHDFMRQKGYYFGFLTTSIYPFYEKLGWVRFPFPEAFYKVTIDAGINLPRPSNKYKINIFDKNRDLQGVLELYNKFNRNRNGTVDRTKNYWENYFIGPTRWWTENPENFLVAIKNNKILAYARITPHQVINEIAYDAEQPSALESVLYILIKRMKDKGIKEIKMYPVQELVDIFSQLFGSVEKFSPAEQMMFYLLDLKKLFRGIRSLLENRLSQSSMKNWQGEIPITCEDESILFRIYEGRLDILDNTKGGNNSNNLILKKNDIFKLIFGYGIKGIKTQGYNELLNILFPSPTFRKSGV